MLPFIVVDVSVADLLADLEIFVCGLWLAETAYLNTNKLTVRATHHLAVGCGV